VYSLVRLVPDSPSDPRPVVAAFDVDGTLTTRDCVTPFLRRAGGLRLARALLGHPRALLRALARRDRDSLKELACSSLAGLDGETLDGLGERFAREVAETRLRADTTARLRRHRELGHTVVLASASLDPYLVPLGRLLEVDGVVCTVLERDSGGRLTGRLVGENCRGREKELRLRAWLAANGLEDAELWAYGDSAGDAELLAGADHPVWVGRELVAEPLG
jgi:phosphatidylglycerophosphatase C